jgi:hypothetical protein
LIATNPAEVRKAGHLEVLDAGDSVLHIFTGFAVIDFFAEADDQISRGLVLVDLGFGLLSPSRFNRAAANVGTSFLWNTYDGPATIAVDCAEVLTIPRVNPAGRDIEELFLVVGVAVSGESGNTGLRQFAYQVNVREFVPLPAPAP